MKIETKFNVGDKFFAIKDGKATEMKVQTIYVYASSEGDKVSYIPNGVYSQSYEEKYCFTSREELINSL